MIGKGLIVFASLIAASTAADAEAQQKCPFTYADSARDEIIIPALKKWESTAHPGRNLETYYDLTHDFTARDGDSIAKNDGKIILVFLHSPGTEIDGDELDVVVDPCERRVVYAKETSSVVSVGSGTSESSDDAIRSGLVGAWVVSPDNWFSFPGIDFPGYPQKPSGSEMRAVERFRPDGSGIAVRYQDSACTKTKASAAFTWHVKDHVLTIVPSKIAPDGVLVMGTGRVELQGIGTSVQPGAIRLYQDRQDPWDFVRASSCAWP